MKEIGRGAFGKVYLAHDEGDRPVAIKIAHADKIEAAGGVEIYRNEVQAHSCLDHPHIVKVIDAKTTADGICYIVTQYVNGRNLAAYLQEGPLSYVAAAGLAASLAEALQHAHTEGFSIVTRNRRTSW